MIIARASQPDNESEFLILGLSRENVRRLLENGEPIHIKQRTHGEGVPKGWEIIIIFGETERSMQAEFEKHGMIGPDTKIHRDPRL